VPAVNSSMSVYPSKPGEIAGIGVNRGTDSGTDSDLTRVDGSVTVGGAVNYAQAVKRFRTAVVAAVHVEQKSIQGRSRNIVICGLRSVDKVSDAALIRDFLADNLGLKVTVATSKRIGHDPDVSRRRVLVTMGTADQAATVIEAAKRLRFSPDPEIRGKVFITADLTVAERKAAYELRCKRRMARQRQNNRSPQTASRMEMESITVTSEATPFSGIVPVVIESTSNPLHHRGSGSGSGPGAQDAGAAGAAGADATYATTSGTAAVPFLTAVTAATASTFQPVGHASIERSDLSASAPTFVPFDLLVADAADGRLANGCTQC
jgi:hypothetical protein